MRWIGVSNFDVKQMRRAQSIAPITSLQPPYSLINRGVEEDILPYCLREDIGVIVYSPMASGLLTGAMTRERIARPARRMIGASSDPEFKEPKLSRNLALVEQLREIGKRHGRSPGEVAIAWTLRNPAVTGAIVGARNARQADGVMRAGEFHLSERRSKRNRRLIRRVRRLGSRTDETIVQAESCLYFLPGLAQRHVHIHLLSSRDKW